MTIPHLALAIFAGISLGAIALAWFLESTTTGKRIAAKILNWIERKG